MQMNNPSREELVWWYNPKLLQWHGWFREHFARGEDWCQGVRTPENKQRYEQFWHDCNALGIHGDWREPDNTEWSFVATLPVILFIRGKWEMEQMWCLDEARLFTVKNWDLDRKITANSQNISTIWRVLYLLNDPRTIDPGTVPEQDDTARVVRFIQQAFERFVLSDNPSIPSLWKEGDKVLCGWNDLYPDDGRLPPSYHGYNLTQPLYYNGAYFGNLHEWRHMVPQ